MREVVWGCGHTGRRLGLYGACSQMAERAQPLIELHLLETPDLPRLENLAVPFAKQGSRVVDQHYPRSNPVAGRVYINPTHCFERVTAEMW